MGFPTSKKKKKICEKSENSVFGFAGGGSLTGGFASKYGKFFLGGRQKQGAQTALNGEARVLGWGFKGKLKKKKGPRQKYFFFWTANLILLDLKTHPKKNNQKKTNFFCILFFFKRGGTGEYKLKTKILREGNYKTGGFFFWGESFLGWVFSTNPGKKTLLHFFVYF